MKIETGWVTPPVSIGGLDHLGTQAPCVLIYAQLLPGITNVTDRARYYSLYPWFIWSFDQRYPKDAEKFVEFFRRSDCLFTLISERHSRITDHDNERHGAAMVGRVKLLQALDRLEAGHPLTLSDYTAQNSKYRYFQNPMGGLGQYYAGSLSDLKLINGSDKPWFNYTEQYGAPLAKQLNSTVDADQFWALVESGVVTLSDLDNLSGFCACRLPESIDECNTLTDLYFDRKKLFNQVGVQRSKSLGLILNLVNSLENIDLSESVFRACTYSGSLPGQVQWDVPSSLRSTLDCWALYQRNNLLSIACQTVFAVALRELEPQNSSSKVIYQSVESFAEYFSNGPVIIAVTDKIGVKSLGDLVDSLVSLAPSVNAWDNENHEIQIAERMLTAWDHGKDSTIIFELLISVLALLACRDVPQKNPYGGLYMPLEALEDYPINLVSFQARVKEWKKMSIPKFVEDLVTWCLNTHLKVALRKLRYTGRSTFHLRPTERGMEVIDKIPPPANTRPRFRQSVQILRDIGVLTRDNSKLSRPTILSINGKILMETASA